MLLLQLLISARAAFEVLRAARFLSVGWCSNVLIDCQVCGVFTNVVTECHSQVTMETALQAAFRPLRCPIFEPLQFSILRFTFLPRFSLLHLFFVNVMTFCLVRLL